jgi:hypothetical protein
MVDTPEQKGPCRQLLHITTKFYYQVWSIRRSVMVCGDWSFDGRRSDSEAELERRWLIKGEADLWTGTTWNYYELLITSDNKGSKHDQTHNQGENFPQVVTTRCPKNVDPASFVCFFSPPSVWCFLQQQNSAPFSSLVFKDLNWDSTGSFIQLSSNILYKEHLVQICSNGLRCQQSKIVIRSKHKVSKRRTVPRQLGIFAAPHTFCNREFVVNLVSDFHILD